MTIHHVADAEGFRAVLLTANLHDRIVYHTGSLMHDRQAKGFDGAWQVVDKLADAVRKAYERGLVTMVQRAICTQVFEYHAQVRA